MKKVSIKCVVGVVAIVGVIVILLMFFLYIRPNNVNNEALLLSQEGKFDEALNLLEDVLFFEKTGSSRLVVYGDINLKIKEYIDKNDIQRALELTKEYKDNPNYEKNINEIQSMCKHTFGEPTNVEATCKNNGYIKFVCSICEYNKLETTEALGHKNEDVEIIMEATCFQNGKKKVKCQRCGEENFVDIETIEHSYEDKIIKEATCVEKGIKKLVCNVCGYESNEMDIEVKEHLYGSWSTVKNATSTATGLKNRTCKICGNVESIVIEKLKNGSVSGTLDYYKNYKKTPNAKSKIILIPKNSNVKDYDNGLAALGVKGKYDSGIVVTYCDSLGYYSISDVPVGEYLLLMVSAHTINPLIASDKQAIDNDVKKIFGNYFSISDYSSLRKMINGNEYRVFDITINSGKNTNIDCNLFTGAAH